MSAVQTVEANGTRIAFKRTGKGQPLILIHGAEADHSMFDAFGERLARHFTVIAYDQRDSGSTRNPAAAYGLEELAADAAALISALGFERAHVFGTSLGGAIAQVLTARYGGRVDRLVLSSTFKAGAPPLALNPEVFARLAALRARLPDSAGEIATYFFPESHIARHPEVLAIFNGSRRSDEQKQHRGAILARPVAVSLADIAAPTLIVAGAEDRLIPPAHTLSLANEIAGARTALVPGLGHVGTMQDPDAIAHAILPFLTDGAAAPITTSTEGNDHGKPGGGARRTL
jgi:3-oxoadipate enol-lactonase